MTGLQSIESCSGNQKLYSTPMRPAIPKLKPPDGAIQEFPSPKLSGLPTPGKLKPKPAPTPAYQFHSPF